MDPLALPDHGAINDFMKYYEEDGYLAYEKLSEHSERILARELDELDIKHEIFNRGKEGSAGFRAKAPASTRRTVVKRQDGRALKYKTKEEILSDMHDLAGLRVALYYPNDFKKVEKIIKNRFSEVKQPQDWPDQHFGPFRYPNLDGSTAGRNDISGRHSRFPGYFARHFRVRLQDSDIIEPAVKGKTLEIQLMSLLMHAWSKMHHELIYKPRPGLPQADETDERLLDISSGIIIAGEQVLRQIQINLDKKKELGQLPFKNEHDALGYLKEKWTATSEVVSSEALRSWIMQGDCGRKHPLSHLLYTGLEMIGFNTREKLDLLVQHCLDNYGSSALLSKHVSFVEMLIVSIIDQEDFKLVESEQLELPRAYTRSLSVSEAAKLTRFMALIVCNSLKWYNLDSLHVVWTGRGNFSVPQLSGEDILKVLHPVNSVESLCTMRTLANIRELCEYLLGWDDLTWKLRCAMSRLTYFCETGTSEEEYEKIARGGLYHQYFMTTCPWGFLHLLDYCAEHQSRTLKESFHLLEASERDGMGIYSSQRSQYLPRHYRNYRSARIAYKPSTSMNGDVGYWTVGETTSRGLGTFYGFSVVRAYLDGSISVVQNGDD